MKQYKNDYFPSKLAKGEQFCNRVTERKLLKRNIELARHTVLISPRRYGKSSLVHQIATEIDIPFESIDLFLAHDDKAVIKRVLDGISHIVSQIIPNTHKAAEMVQKYFNNFKVSFNAIGLGLELSRTTSLVDPVDQLFDALRSLACLAEEHKSKILLFIDEFQDIFSVESSKSMQGAIRHVAQDTSWLVFFFSGSNRRLLLDLFDEKSNPLYMLCDKLLLDRISSEDYYVHIQKAAQNRWGCNVSDIAINRILTLVERHPFYVNLLCNELWKSDNLPSMDDVMNAWMACFETEERRLVVELERLTVNQQNILKAIALNPINEPTSQAFLSSLNVPLSSVRLGIKSLVEKDMLYVIKKEDNNLPGIKKGQYRVLDPLLSFMLRKYS